ncbi:xanthine dehydrogenase family protein molybdopterin-binding subunit [Allostreptomyces psammosilenae]|uniref:Xanthine dehydrogenase YagR molybdenum-binding subunit n=1 Tax=Allostreptomyces psammosilenae TaxID=1892865 RepID=A0A852ZY72_9ACTN|nr:xanthine dehydrogenase family protein molybdopterin-binding subunit [Allostreptomyces psammosilenae]NYI06747.1 xanthine dehydrogenase YagR molybdenum-binding subunit [Allostreptomyces psammosilenae]
MTTLRHVPSVGAGVDRVDGPAKVTGAAAYPGDVHYPDLAHAALVRSTIAAGRVRAITTDAAEAVPGVLAVLTHANAPRVERAPDTALGAAPPPPLRDDRIIHHGQYLAVVVAETAEAANEAARLVRVDYEPAEALLDPHDPRAETLTDPARLDTARGDAATALASADVLVEATYTTPEETNNPLGPFTTVAAWDGTALTVHDSTQWPYAVRAALARAFDVPENGVQVLARHVGGGFGAGLRVWPHVVLAALAARVTGRPVRLELTRPQMFTGVGHRPSTVQRVRIGATRDGDLVGVEHESTSVTAIEDDTIEPAAAGTSNAYACPNVATRDRAVRLHLPSPGPMRAPGEAQGNFALECALDELAHELRMDPLQLRLRNHADVQQTSGLPWSSNALRDAYEQGAARFGWHRRTPDPGSMRDGRWLVGLGMAGVTFPWYQQPCRARASMDLRGTALVRSAVTDIGTGTATVMTQLAADLLGLPLARVRFDLGDTDMPMAPQAGGSGLTGALGSAVHAACRQLVEAFLDLVWDDPGSPLRGLGPADVTVAEGRIHRTGQPALGESYTDILARHGVHELTADGDSAPPRPEDIGMAPAGAFGARFVEVRVDPSLGLLRVSRVVTAVDAGRVLNAKTATSQIVGGTVGGIGMALMERTERDPGTGRVADATLGDYLVPVHADVPEMEVLFVGGPDPVNPAGTKGVGEIGLVGVAAAVANAVFHATGRRVRDLPITVEDLL